MTEVSKYSVKQINGKLWGGNSPQMNIISSSISSRMKWIKMFKTLMAKDL